MSPRMKAVSPVVAASLIALATGVSAAPIRTVVSTRGDVPQGTASYTFPDTSVGQTSTACFSVCFTQGSTCDGSDGTASVVYSPQAPFAFSGTPYLNLLGDACDAAVGLPVTFPAYVPLDFVISFDVAFSPTAATTYNGVVGVGEFAGPAVFDLSGRGTAGFGCVSDSTTLCIDQNPGDGRFKVQMTFNTVEGGGRSGAGNAIPLSSLGVTGGGLFWLFNATNPELLIKMIDGCGLNSDFWVFFAATTNVGFTVTVTDMKTQNVATYANPDQHAASPVQDTSALPCP